MGYKIMNRELTAYSLKGFNCPSYYENNKYLYTDPKYVCYGDVLVETERVCVGFEIRLKLFFRNHWYWKPRFYWKYGDRYFHWLFFMFWINKEYGEVNPKIIKDHLKDELT